MITHFVKIVLSFLDLISDFSFVMTILSQSFDTELQICVKCHLLAEDLR